MRISDWSSDVCSSDLLDWLAIAQMRVERFELTIEPRGDAAIAEFRMHGVSEVDWRSAALQLADLATRREYINLIRKQVDLDVVDEEIGRASCRERVCQYV